MKISVRCTNGKVETTQKKHGQTIVRTASEDEVWGEFLTDCKIKINYRVDDNNWEIGVVGGTDGGIVVG